MLKLLISNSSTFLVDKCFPDYRNLVAASVTVRYHQALFLPKHLHTNELFFFFMLSVDIGTKIMPSSRPSPSPSLPTYRSKNTLRLPRGPTAPEEAHGHHQGPCSNQHIEPCGERTEKMLTSHDGLSPQHQCCQPGLSHHHRRQPAWQSLQLLIDKG